MLLPDLIDSYYRTGEFSCLLLSLLYLTIFAVCLSVLVPAILVLLTVGPRISVKTRRLLRIAPPG